MIPALKIVAVAVAVAGGVTAGVVHHRHAAVAARPTVAAAPAVAADAPAAPPAADSPPAAGEDSLARAQDAYVHGEYDQAIELARPSVAASPKKAWRVIGAASCFKQDANGATEAWNALDPQGRKFVEYVCKRNDVTLPDGAPVL